MSTIALYVMGDFHLSESTNKPMDIFGPTWEKHGQKIAQNWPLTDSDTIVINGDLSWAMNLDEAAADFEFLETLKGRKILIKGNHDYWWNTISKLTKFAQSYPSIHFLQNNAYESDNCFICGTRGWILEQGQSNSIKVTDREIARLRMSLAMYKCMDPCKDAYVFLHYPPIFASECNNGIIALLHEYGIRHCYYGHLHGQTAHNNAYIGEFEGINMHLTSCDYLNFIPLKVH